MPFSLTHPRLKKSSSTLKAPARKARLAHDEIFDTMKAKKPQALFKTISIDLDGVVSTLMKNGNWCVEHENKTESKHLLHQTQVNEKLKKEKEMLRRRNEILIDMAKLKTQEIGNIEMELNKLRRIVKKCVPKSARKCQ